MDYRMHSRAAKIVKLALEEQSNNNSDPVDPDEHKENNENDVNEEVLSADDPVSDDDSVVDKDYLPSETSSDTDDQPASQTLSRQAKTRKVGSSNKINISQPQEVGFKDLLENDLYLSDDEVSNADGTLDEDDSITDSVANRPIKKRMTKNKTSIKQPGRKRARHSDKWLCNVRKQKKLSGKEYVNKKNKIVPAKNMKPPCSCRKKCYDKLSEIDRQDIFSRYWSEENSNDMKRQFVRSCVISKPTARSRKRNADSGKSKSNSLLYNFLINNSNINVCKIMFLNTLGISNKVVVNVLKKTEHGGLVETDLRGKHAPRNKTPVEVIENIKSHISSFPSYESHYTREKTAKKYLGSDLTIKKMYSLYTLHCAEKNIHPNLVAKPWLYSHVFNTEFNLSFKTPGMDTCDVCDSFIAKLKGELNQDQRDGVKADQEAHLLEAKKRYDLKSLDTNYSKQNSTHKVLTCDLQKCLPTPLITNSISFYKRKLWTFNFTIYDSSDSSVHCMMWDESKGARGGNEMASGLLKWANTVIPDSTIQQITIWTDNCYGQNKNKSVIMAFFWILKTYPQIQQIDQKFLLKGHTHMEADTVHGHIERKRKKVPNMTIVTPWDWQQLVRQTSTKYTVYNMECEDFKQFSSLFTGTDAPFVSRKVDTEKEPVLMSTCVHLQVRQEAIGKVFFKTSFDGVFKELDMVRSRRNKDIRWPDALQPVSNDLLPISRQKYNDLISLLPYLPSVCHDFYKNLPSSSNSHDYPKDDENEEFDI